MKKITTFLVSSALVLGLALPASAQTNLSATATSDLMEQLQSLQAQIISVRAQLAAQLGLRTNGKSNPPIIPKGIMKKVEKGKELPKGILKKIENRLEHERDREEREDERDERREERNRPDIVAPSILGVTVVDRTQTSARILWTTNEKSTSKLWIGSSSSVATTSATAASSTDLTFFHSLTVTGLQPGTTYFYVVGGADASGNLSVSTSDSFATLASDVSMPSLFGITAIQVRNDGARIIWATDERADSKVWASTTSPVVTTGAALKSTSNLTFFHDLQLTGLTSSTTYHFVVGSADASGNLKVSNEFSFTTSAQ